MTDHTGINRLIGRLCYLQEILMRAADDMNSDWTDPPYIFREKAWPIMQDAEDKLRAAHDSVTAVVDQLLKEAKS